MSSGHAMRALYERGRQCWPTVFVPEATFAAHVARVVDDVTSLSGLHGDGLYLAAACCAGDGHAITVFRDAFADDVAAVIHRLGLAEHRAEISQSLMRQLFVPDAERPPFIVSYAGRGALGSWLRVVCVREAYRIVRALRQTGKREILSDDLLVERAVDDRDPELSHLRTQYQAAFRAAFHQAFETLSRRDRQVLRYCYLDGLNLDAVAKIYNVSRATAARWRLGAQQAILGETRKVLETSLRVDGRELESLMRVVRSQLDLSIVRLLASSNPE